MEKFIEKTVTNLERNNIKAFYVKNKNEVVPLIKTLITKGETISCGGSMSLKECGINDEILNSGDYDFVDRTGLTGDALRECYGRAFMADTYFCSSNAVTEEGQLYNVDGNSNRVACIVYGPKQVIMVVGKNKIVPTIDDAIARVKTIAAPLNTQRLNCTTPCMTTGECISLSKENPALCDGCLSEGRICCNYVVSGWQRHKDRIKVIIVNEEIGY